jgi:hypothetical protein
MHFLSLSWMLHDSSFQVRPTIPVPFRNKHELRRGTFSYSTNPPDEETTLFGCPCYLIEVLAASLHAWRLSPTCDLNTRHVEVTMALLHIILFKIICTEKAL